MFGKDGKTKPVEVANIPTTEEPRPRGGARSLLAQGAKFTGRLESQAGVQIDGNFNGDIDMNDTLMVGKDGMVNAKVKARTVVVHGKLEGEINATAKIELMAGCKVVGDMKSPSVVIQDGVEFEGTLKIEKKIGGK